MVFFSFLRAEFVKVESYPTPREIGAPPRPDHRLAPAVRTKANEASFTQDASRRAFLLLSARATHGTPRRMRAFQSMCVQLYIVRFYHSSEHEVEPSNFPKLEIRKT